MFGRTPRLSKMIIRRLYGVVLAVMCIYNTGATRVGITVIYIYICICMYVTCIIHNTCTTRVGVGKGKYGG